MQRHAGSTGSTAERSTPNDRSGLKGLRRIRKSKTGRRELRQYVMHDTWIPPSQRFAFSIIRFAGILVRSDLNQVSITKCVIGRIRLVLATSRTGAVTSPNGGRNQRIG